MRGGERREMDRGRGRERGMEGRVGEGRWRERMTWERKEGSLGGRECGSD